MSSGLILLTKDRIENSIPYISLNSWQQRERDNDVTLSHNDDRYENMSNKSYVQLCLQRFKWQKREHKQYTSNKSKTVPHLWRFLPVSCGSTRCNEGRSRCGRICISYERSSERNEMIKHTHAHVISITQDEHCFCVVFTHIHHSKRWRISLFTFRAASALRLTRHLPEQVSNTS